MENRMVMATIRTPEVSKDQASGRMEKLSSGFKRKRNQKKKNKSDVPGVQLNKKVSQVRR